ncbi:MAG: hypothetical protein JWM57_3498 [Phycisphaerales bacterium]|nr:hypothetical protein [Phycisphaerales bacterium]
MLSYRSMVAALLLASTAQAELKTERIAVTPGSADTSYAMSSSGLDPAATIAEFVKQTGINVVYERSGGGFEGGPTVVYDVEFKDLSRVEAIKEVARTLSLGVMRMGSNSPPRLSPNSWSGESERRPEKQVELGYLTRNQTFPPSPNQTDSLDLQFRIWSGRRPLDGPVKVKLDEATDDQGRDLLANNREPTYYDGPDGDRYVTDRTLQLQFPSPPPKKIATLKGNGVLARPKTILRLKVDGLDQGTQSGDLNGAAIAIGPMKPNGPQYSLPIVITRGTLGNEAWQSMQQRINQLGSTVVVKGAKGEMLQFQTNGWGSDGRKLTIQSGIITPDANGNPSGQAIVPATLQWDTVIETTDELIPFTLTNIDIP